MRPAAILPFLLNCLSRKHLSAALVILSLVPSVGYAQVCREHFREAPSVSQRLSEFTSSPGVPAEENLSQFLSWLGLKFNPQFKALKGMVHSIFSGSHSPLKRASLSKAVPHPEGMEQSFTVEVDVPTPHSVKVRTPVLFGSKIIKNPQLIGEIWKTNDGSFRFFNPGKSLLVEDASISEVNHHLDKAFQNPRVSAVEVPLNPAWVKARQLIQDRQILASSVVTETYKERKPYLADEDLFFLRYQDWSTPHLNDFLMLLKDSGRSPLAMTAEEFRDQLALVLRVARLDHRSWVQSKIILNSFGFEYEMPHSARLHHQIKDKVRVFFDQLAIEGNLRVAELSRFNMISKVPDEIMDAFLLKMFLLTQQAEKKVDLYILECDDFTRRLFASRYKFKMLIQITPDSIEDGSPSGKKLKSKAEYLMYLVAGSREHQELIEKLQNSAARVHQRPDSEPPPLQKWTSDWGIPKSFWNHSWWTKRAEAEEYAKGKKFSDNQEMLLSSVHVELTTRGRVTIAGQEASWLGQALKDFSTFREVSYLENPPAAYSQDLVVLVDAFSADNFRKAALLLKSGGKITVSFRKDSNTLALLLRTAQDLGFETTGYGGSETSDGRWQEVSLFKP